MESDSNRTNVIIVGALLAVLVLVAVMAIISHILVKNKMNNSIINNDDQEIEENTNKNATIVYSGYKKGEKVELSDSSNWHVIEDSNVNEEYVLLLKDEKINKSITKQVVDDYLQNEYKEEIVNSLECGEEDIQNIRLLTSTDIKNITGINPIKIGIDINKDKYDYLVLSKTLTNMIVNTNPVIICEEEGKYTLCEGKIEEEYEIRPVIKINKNYLK